MRGRRVVILLFLFIIQTSLQFHSVKTTFAAEPSTPWKEAVSQYSKIILETQNPDIFKPVKISILSKGLLEEITPNQKMKVTVYVNSKEVQEVNLQSGANGSAGFAFVPKEYGTYLLHVENITYKKPITLIPLSFSIQKSPSLLDSILQFFLK
jgi:hypothetical protein